MSALFWSSFVVGFLSGLGFWARDELDKRERKDGKDASASLQP